MQMRAGTQTLIQALQALPWVEDPDDVDEPVSRIDPDSDEEPTGKQALTRTFKFKLGIAEFGSQSSTWPLLSTPYIVLLPDRDGARSRRIQVSRGKAFPRKEENMRHPIQNPRRIQPLTMTMTSRRRPHGQPTLRNAHRRHKCPLLL